MLTTLMLQLNKPLKPNLKVKLKIGCLTKSHQFQRWWLPQSLFVVEKLGSCSQGGGQPPSEDSKLGKQIVKQFGSLDKLIEITNGKLAGIQGSGWAFIVKNKANGDTIDVITAANQDTVTDPNLVPLIAIDAWEHAYYLQYQNVKADYFKNLWHVINWKEAERRFEF